MILCAGNRCPTRFEENITLHDVFFRAHAASTAALLRPLVVSVRRSGETVAFPAATGQLTDLERSRFAHSNKRC
jgi:hypothetical protein